MYQIIYLDSAGEVFTEYVNDQGMKQIYQRGFSVKSCIEISDEEYYNV